MSAIFPLHEESLLSGRLTQEFNRSAAQYHAAFPAQLKKLLVIFGTEQIYASPEIAGHLANNAKQAKKFIARTADEITTVGDLGWAGRRIVGWKPLNYIALNRLSATDAIEKTWTFDHEMGHLVVKRDWSQNSTECAADAFAALRHIQRFGGIKDCFTHSMRGNAYHAIFESPIDHYTSAAIQKVANLYHAGSIDIQNMSLQDTAALAGEIARIYGPANKTLRKIHKAFAPVRKAYMDDYMSSCEAIIQIMLDHKDDHDIYRAGKLFITDYFPRHPALNTLAQHEKNSGFNINAADVIDAARTEKERQHAARPAHWSKIWLQHIGRALGTQ